MTNPSLSDLLDTLTQRIEDLEEVLQERYRIRATAVLTVNMLTEAGLDGTRELPVHWGKIRSEWRLYVDDETLVVRSSALTRKTVALQSDRLVSAIQEAATQQGHDVEQAVDALDATIRSLEAI